MNPQMGCQLYMFDIMRVIVGVLSPITTRLMGEVVSTNHLTNVDVIASSLCEIHCGIILQCGLCVCFISASIHWLIMDTSGMGVFIQCHRAWIYISFDLVCIQHRNYSLVCYQLQGDHVVGGILIDSRKKWTEDEGTSTPCFGTKEKMHVKEVVIWYQWAILPELRDIDKHIEDEVHKEYEVARQTGGYFEDSFSLLDLGSTRFWSTQFHCSVEVYWITKLLMAQAIKQKKDDRIQLQAQLVKYIALMQFF